MTDLSQYSDAELAQAAGASPQQDAPVNAGAAANPAGPLDHFTDDELKAAAGVSGQGTAPKIDTGAVPVSFKTAVTAQIPFASDVSGLSHAIAKGIAGNSGGFSADYDEGRKQFWAANEAYKQQNPISDKLAQVIGTAASLGSGPAASAAKAVIPAASDAIRGAVSPILEKLGLGGSAAGADAVAAAVPQAAEAAIPAAAGGGGILAQSIRSGAVAAPVAGVYSYGASDNAGPQRFGDAALGAATGGVLGLAAPAAGSLFKTLVGQIADRSGLSGSTLGNMLGVATPEDRAGGLLARALSRDNTTPDQIAGSLALNPSKPLTIADVAGAPTSATSRLTRSILDLPGQGSSSGAQFLADRDLGTPVNGPYDMFRQGGTADRVAGDVKSALGSGDASQTIDQLVAQRKANAAPLYDAFNQEPALEASKLQPFMASPTFRTALSRANGAVLDEGGEPLANYFALNEAGDPVSVKNGAVPPDVLNRVKQGLDDTWIAAKQSGDPGAARTANSLRSRFLGFMDAAYPNTYAAARSAYAGPSATIDAIQQGMDVFHTAPEQVASTLQGLSPEDQPMFRLGVQKALLDKVQNTPDGANEVIRLFGSPAKRDSIAAAFDNPDALNQFSQNLGLENRMYQTRQLGAGSRTAPSAADQGDLLNGAAEVGAHMAGGLGGGLLKAGSLLFDRLRSGVGEQTGSVLAKALLNPDPVANANTLRMLAQRPTPAPTSPLMGALLAGRLGSQAAPQGQ